MTNKRLPLINMSLHAPIVCLSVSLRKETGCEFPSNSVPNTIGLPLSGRLYFRKSQLPLQSQDSDHTVVFRTKCELVVELIREQARITGGRHLGIFDGAYALRSVVRPLVQPEPGHPRIEFLTRLRPDARLYALPPPGCRANQKWGRRLPPPCQG